jgi:hypothetical protein
VVLLWGDPGTRHQKEIQATVSRFPGLTRIATRTANTIPRPATQFGGFLEEFCAF